MTERYERGGTVVDPRQSLALWLRAGRAQRKLSLDEVARITKIQPRILEKLESGRFDGLPAEVFVKGFVRSFARCVGLDETEALERYADCQAVASKPLPPIAPAPTASPSSPVSLSVPDPIPDSIPVPVPVPVSAPAPAPAPVTVTAPAPVTVTAPVTAPVTDTASASATDLASSADSKKKRRRKRSRNKKPTTTTPTVTTTTAVATTTAPAPEASSPDATVDAPVIAEGSGPIPAEPAAATAEPPTPPAQPWTPTMPPLPTSSPPWRRPSFAPSAPSLVIDDADPDRAEREQEARTTAAREQKVSFLPPILLDRDDRAGQGGLTLAVIMLLIAATLTLSYLMRRPSVRGDGVTMLDTPHSLLAES